MSSLSSYLLLKSLETQKPSTINIHQLSITYQWHLIFSAFLLAYPTKQTFLAAFKNHGSHERSTRRARCRRLPGLAHLDLFVQVLVLLPQALSARNRERSLGKLWRNKLGNLICILNVYYMYTISFFFQHFEWKRKAVVQRVKRHNFVIDPSRKANTVQRGEHSGELCPKVVSCIFSAEYVHPRLDPKLPLFWLLPNHFSI